MSFGPILALGIFTGWQFAPALLHATVRNIQVNFGLNPDVSVENKNPLRRAFTHERLQPVTSSSGI